MEELREYLRPLLKWWWMLVLASLAAAVSSYVVVLQQPEIYQSRATIMVGNAITDPNPSSNQFYLAQQLAAAYAEFANRGQMSEAVKETLGLAQLPEYSVRSLPNSQMMEVAVVDTRPDRAQAVASALADQLLLLSPANSAGGDTTRDEFVDRQLDTLQQQIQEADLEIATLKEELGNLNSARQIADMESQIAAIESKRSQLQMNFADLLANTSEGAVNSLTIITPANLPVIPIGPNKVSTVLISALIGFSIAAAAAYILEYIGGTIETLDDVERLFPYDVIGVVGQIGKKDDVWSYVAENPRSPISEGFMNLVSSLELAQNGRDIKGILISSSMQGEGKSVISMNLALTLARLGRKVILVDLDLRIPTLNMVYDLKEKPGLSDYLDGERRVGDFLIQTENPNLRILTSGTPYDGANPLIMASNRISELLEALKDEADIIVYDAPPIFMAETSYMMNKVDGAILVVRPGFAKKQPVKAMLKHLGRIEANVIGIVANDVPGQKFGYYSGYYGYAYQGDNQ